MTCQTCGGDSQLWHMDSGWILPCPACNAVERLRREVARLRNEAEPFEIGGAADIYNADLLHARADGIEYAIDMILAEPS